MKLSDWLPSRGTESLANLFGVVRRRLWAQPGKAHIELPDLEDDEYEDFTATLQESLESESGVYWASANGPLGRMIVAWDETLLNLEDILAIVKTIEHRFHFTDGPFSEDRVDHPGDDEPITRHIAQMGADVLGASAGFLMKALRRTPGRARGDLAALMSVVDNVPHIRKALSRRLGSSVTDTGIGLTNPLIQGWGSGPISPLVDLGFQAVQLREAVARRKGFNRREADLCSRPERAFAPRIAERRRPIPIPEGPIEHYADDAWNMSLGGFIVGLADTQDLHRAITPLLDALPKPARFGRGSFASSLGVVLSDRDLIVMNKNALRRLDRIDCIIVDDSLLITDQWTLDRIITGTDVDPVIAYQRAEEMLDSTSPELRQQQDDWTLGPAQNFDLDDQWQERISALKRRGDFLALTKAGEVVAVFSLRSVTNPASKALIEAIRSVDLELIIATDNPDRLSTFHPDRVVESGESVKRFIRHIQRDYQVIAFFCDGPHPALGAADCSMGFTIRGKEVPWMADIIAGDNLDDATFLIEAMDVARTVSEKSAALAGAGAGIGAFSAIRGLKKTHPGRVMLAVNTASILALIYGTASGIQLGRRLRPSPSTPTPWHRLRVDHILERLETTREGLSKSEVEGRKTPHEEPLSSPRRLGGAIVQELSNPLTPVLAAGAAVSAVVGSVMDASIVGAVIAVNGLIGGIERFNSEAAMEKMARRDVNHVPTRRDGEIRMVTDEDLVAGDIIQLKAGDVVPADCRILTSDRLEVDESSLTGESLPVSKSNSPSFSPLPAERSSMLYEGTAIATGSCEAVVVATGHETEAQQAYAISSSARGRPHGVEARLSRLTDLSLPFASLSGGILMSLGILRRQKLQKLVGPAVNLAVSAVPEGLPLLSTTAQLAASRRLSQRNVLVNNPRAMEALGRTDLLCIDKTGTLTEGTLTLHSVFDGDSTLGRKDFGDTHRELLSIALRATPPPPEEGELHHATDRAIIKGAEDSGAELGPWSPTRELPFKSELAFHAVIGDLDSEHKLAVKGSPEAVLARCHGQRAQGKWKRLSNARREKLLEISHNLAGQGLRILAVAERRFTPGDDEETLRPEDISGLTFYGFLALSDPLRPTSAQAVKALRSAGVSVMMLTGDHPNTAQRIATDAGLITSNGVLSGHDIDAMSDEELAAILPETTVIARTTPAHKVRIVEALQAEGRVVAMTGDGANDAAAIRLADVGIALGSDSARAARDAADLVVTDSRLETIVDAIVEGRAMWRSVRDAVSILIGGNIGEVGFMLASGVTSTTPALNSRQLLLVNLFTDVAPALAIALRPPPEVSPDQLLHEGPEESLGKPLERDIMWRAAITGTSAYIAWFLAQHTFQKKTASTVGLLTVVTSQLGQTLTTARPTAPVWAASVGSLAVLLAIIETPGLSQLVGCKPLGPMGLTTSFASAAGATVASSIIPRIPEWRRRILEVIPERDEPDVQDFLDEFFELSYAQS